jgi:hypothetical protein
MANITIKKIDPRVLKRLAEQAKKRRLSLNAYLKEQLAGLVALKPGAKTYSDLSHLAGTWTLEEEKEFLTGIQPLSEIDEDLWK